jgi:SAM-dependent methyltransferase
MGWTEALFDADYARVWGFPGAEVTAAEVLALSTMLPAPPARVLDVACGNGRHAIALAARGYQVTGVDLAAPFLVLARDAARVANVEVDFRQSDMRHVNADLTGFDAAIVLGNSFGYHEDEENLSTLEAIARTVRVGGLVLLELLNRDRIVANYRPRGSHPSADGRTTIEFESTLDPITGINTVVHRWTTLDGAPRERVSKQRLYTPPELVALCRAANLRPSGWYDGVSLRPFDLQARRLLVVAERRAAPESAQGAAGTRPHTRGPVTMFARIDAIAGLLGEHFRCSVDPADFRQFLRDVLEGERDLMGAHAAGLVTTDEVVEAVIDRGAVHLLGAPKHMAARDTADLDRLREQVRGRLFGNGPWEVRR